MTSEATVVCQIDSGVARITLNRPAQYNAIDLATATALLSAATACSTDPSVRVVVVSGAGPKAFCAGGDVPSFAVNAGRIRTFAREITDPLHMALARLVRMDAIVVAAVNGATAGVGLGFIGAADLVLAADGATFTCAYTGIGVSPDAGTTYHLTRLIGPRRALDLMLTNRVLTAREALEWGLVNRLVPGAELEAQVAQLASTLAKGPQHAHTAIKQLVRQAVDDRLEVQLDREADSIARLMESRDGREGVAAFAAKRRPVFGQNPAPLAGTNP